MHEFEEYNRNKGWWFLLQLLIAEQKSQHNKHEYQAYCEQVFGYLHTPPKSLDRGMYSYGTK